MRASFHVGRTDQTFERHARAAQRDFARLCPLPVHRRSRVPGNGSRTVRRICSRRTAKIINNYLRPVLFKRARVDVIRSRLTTNTRKNQKKKKREKLPTRNERRYSTMHAGRSGFSFRARMCSIIRRDAYNSTTPVFRRCSSLWKRPVYFIYDLFRYGITRVRIEPCEIVGRLS